MCQKFWTFMWTKIKKKSTFFKRAFFSSSEKLTFEKENVMFSNTFLNLNLFYWIVVNFLQISFIYECSELQVYEIFPKHSFSTVFWNCSPILFLNSQRFSHHFSDFLKFLNNTLTFRKAKNQSIWYFSKALIFQILRNISKDFLSFFDFPKIVVSSVLLDSKKIRAMRKKYEVVYIIFRSQVCQIFSSFMDLKLIIIKNIQKKKFAFGISSWSMFCQ